MSKAIKVEDQVYEELDQLRGKSETFSQVIQELLSNRSTMFEILVNIGRAVKFDEWKARRLQELEEANRNGEAGREL